MVFTGFTEELIFRGLLQALAGQVLGRGGLLYVAVLFGALHIGYLSVWNVVYVVAVGLVFGYIVRRSGSILGVTLCHGLTNITLFIVLPYVTRNPAASSATLMPYLVALGSSVALIPLAVLGLHAAAPRVVARAT